MAKIRLPDVETINKLYEFDRATGRFFYKRREGEGSIVSAFNTRRAGKEAGAITGAAGQKRRMLSINGRQFYAYRIAWLLYHGSEPDFIDHINGDSLDDREENLRSVSHSENMRNIKLRSDNCSGTLGVSWDQDRNKWMVRIGSFHVGRFDTKEEAIRARAAAEISHGYHPNHGRAEVREKTPSSHAATSGGAAPTPSARGPATSSATSLPASHRH